MPDYRRLYCPGATYFFTVVTFNRRPIFSESSARQILHQAWMKAMLELPFECPAICLLPDHLHALWKLPENDADFSTRWRLIKANFTKRYLSSGGTDGYLNRSRIKKNEHAVWQRRFWEHCIRDDKDFTRHFNYIHLNPVKHGYVKSPIDWPFSYFHKYVKMGYYGAGWDKIAIKTEESACFGE
ncbi:transposase [candidate division KSB1 bacterium]|nr:transposase [candidate division KSB1 bacterium]